MDKSQSNKLLKYVHFLQSQGVSKLYLDNKYLRLFEESAEIFKKSSDYNQNPNPEKSLSDTKSLTNQDNPENIKYQNTVTHTSENSIPGFMDLVAKSKQEKLLTKPMVDSKVLTQQNNVSSDWNKALSLADLEPSICNCLSCGLGYTRNKFVFGEGNINASILFVGEAPGADEDKHGRPFIGRAGQLLTKIINSIGFDRDEVFIANIIKCRPPGNRRPEKSEVEKCLPYLLKQIELINPDFIVALGLTAAESLTGTKYRLKQVRGKQMEFSNKPLMITYHPAALLRNPAWKKDVWEDMKVLQELYNNKHPHDKRKLVTAK